MGEACTLMRLYWGWVGVWDGKQAEGFVGWLTFRLQAV